MAAPFGIVAVGAAALSALVPVVATADEPTGVPRSATHTTSASSSGIGTGTIASSTTVPAVASSGAARSAPGLLLAPGRTVAGTTVVLPALAAPTLRATVPTTRATTHAAVSAQPLATVALPTRRTVTLAANGTLATKASTTQAATAKAVTTQPAAPRSTPRQAAAAQAPVASPATATAQAAWLDPADDPHRRLQLLGLVVALTAAAVGWVFYSGRERSRDVR